MIGSALDRQTAGEPVRLSIILVLASLESINAAGDDDPPKRTASGGEPSAGERGMGPPWRVNNPKLAFSACVSLLQGAICRLLRFQRHLLAVCRYSASAVGYLWSLGVAEVIIFALSHKLFRRFSAHDLLLLSAVCGVALGPDGLEHRSCHG